MPSLTDAHASTETNPGSSPPAGEPSAMAVRLRFAITRLHRLLRQHAADDLTLTQGSTLATVEKRGRITLGDLAQAEQVAPPTITNVVGKLEAQGLVGRTVDPLDRRVNRVSITAAGAAHLASVRVKRTAWLNQRLDGLSTDDLNRIADVLDVLEHLGQEPEPSQDAP